MNRKGRRYNLSLASVVIVEILNVELRPFGSLPKGQGQDSGIYQLGRGVAGPTRRDAPIRLRGGDLD